jgi:hypothetical protein
MLIFDFLLRLIYFINQAFFQEIFSDTDFHSASLLHTIYKPEAFQGLQSREENQDEQTIIAFTAGRDCTGRRTDGRILSMKLFDRPPAPPEYRVKVLREVNLLRIPARSNGNNNAHPRH